MVEQGHEWKYVQWVWKASDRTVGKGADKAKHYRRRKVPIPVDDPAKYHEELALYAPAWAKKAQDALFVGVPLIGNKDLWPDVVAASGKVSDAKVIKFVYDHMNEEPYAEFLRNDEKPKAEAHAREVLSEVNAEDANAITDDEAKKTNQVYKAIADDARERFHKTLPQ